MSDRRPRLTRLLRREIAAALRNGTVPERGLEHLAVGLDRFRPALEEELQLVANGKGVFKAVRGDYGAGKTFFSRWAQWMALEAGFVTSEVQISENDTPLYRLETVYRRALEALQTRELREGGFRQILESWFLGLEEEITRRGGPGPEDAEAFTEAVGSLLEARLGEIASVQPQFAAALRGCHRARVQGDVATVEGLVGWLMGQPHVAQNVKRVAGIKGDIDHTAALGFLRGLLTVIKQTGRKGLFLVLDEVETIQRVRSDARERSLNALRQLVDDIQRNRFPGLYVLVTGTPAFFDGPQGVRRLEPLAQRLEVDFSGNPKFDNTRAIQVRLLPFDQERLEEVGRLVRDLYPARDPERFASTASDDLVATLARGVAGQLGGRVGIAPRLYLKKLVGEVLDRVDEHPDFDPRIDYKLMLRAGDLSAEEQAATEGRNPDDIDIPL